MKKINLFGFITLFGILHLVILFKVFNVPVVTDEYPTACFYSHFSFWEIMMYPDNIPNNHILNTLFSKCSIHLFGREQWAIRLPNLLFFFFYGYGVFRILKLVLGQDSLFFLPVAIFFINPYLLDFFGLSRGYGISSTMVLISAGFLISGYFTKNPKHIWISFATSILASYANFSVLVFWAAITIMAWLYFVIDNKIQIRRLIKPTLVFLITSLAYLALIITPIQKMHSTDEFQYWTSRGFYEETIKSLIHFWRYDSEILYKINSNFYVGLITLVILFNIIWFLNRLYKNGFSLQTFFQPFFVGTTLLLLTVSVNLLQTKILGTPNLFGRTALFFVPLFSIVFAIAIGLLFKQKTHLPIKAFAIVLGCIFLANLTSRIKLNSVKEWHYDQNTLEVINYLKDVNEQKSISLRTSWFFHPSFTFYSQTGKTPWIKLHHYDYNLDINSNVDYYYIFAKDYKFLEPRFEVVYKFSPDRWLLRQKKF